MRQLIIAYAMLLAMGLAGTFVIRSKRHRLRGLRQIRWAGVAALIGLAFMFLRETAPIVIVAVGGQTAVLISFAFLYLALARAVGRPSRLFPFFAILLPALVAGLCYFSVVKNEVDGRMAVTMIGTGALLAWTALLAFRHTNPALQTQLRWVFRLLVFVSALRFLRVPITLIFDPNPNLHVLDPVQDFLIYISVLGSLAEAAGIFWISICAQREDDRLRADTDGLTGLLNRRAFEEIVIHSLENPGTGTAEISLLLIDLDFFKKMNDEFGHLAGDTVLRRVSSVLRRSIRAEDALARFGGDEFAVLLRSAEFGQGMQVAERVHQNLIHMRNLPGGRRMTASMGVATALPGDTPLLLIERADRALYRSKDRGRNCLTHFDEDDPPSTGDPVASAFIQ